MDLYQLSMSVGLAPKKVSSTQGGEYHSSCPVCGGCDRFYIQPEKRMKNCTGFYCCRKCGISGDIIQFARDYAGYQYVEALAAFGERNLCTDVDNKTLADLLFKRTPKVYYTDLIVPDDKWISEALCFANSRSFGRNLSSEHAQYLLRRGISPAQIERSKLGYNPRDLFLDRSSWGLPQELNVKGQNKLLWIPKGIVIPYVSNNGKVFKIKVRRDAWREGDDLAKYIVISGSENGMNLYYDQSYKDITIVVEAELDALALMSMFPDSINAVAVGSCLKNPDILTNDLIGKTKKLFICHDNDGSGLKMWHKWMSMYPKSVPLSMPDGKDVGDAVMKGVSVKEFIASKIF
jgi:DNA primase